MKKKIVSLTLATLMATQSCTTYSLSMPQWLTKFAYWTATQNVATNATAILTKTSPILPMMMPSLQTVQTLQATSVMTNVTTKIVQEISPGAKQLATPGNNLTFCKLKGALLFAATAFIVSLIVCASIIEYFGRKKDSGRGGESGPLGVNVQNREEKPKNKELIERERESSVYPLTVVYQLFDPRGNLKDYPRYFASKEDQTAFEEKHKFKNSEEKERDNERRKNLKNGSTTNGQAKEKVAPNKNKPTVIKIESKYEKSSETLLAAGTMLNEIMVKTFDEIDKKETIRERVKLANNIVGDVELD